MKWDLWVVAVTFEDQCPRPNMSMVTLAEVTVDWWQWGQLLWPLVPRVGVTPPLPSPPLDLDLQGKSVCVDSLCHFHKMEPKSTSVKERPTSFHPWVFGIRFVLPTGAFEVSVFYAGIAMGQISTGKISSHTLAGSPFSCSPIWQKRQPRPLPLHRAK